MTDLHGVAARVPLRLARRWRSGRDPDRTYPCKIPGKRPRKTRRAAAMTKDPVCGMQVDERNAPANSIYEGAFYVFFLQHSAPVLLPVVLQCKRQNCRR